MKKLSSNNTNKLSPQELSSIPNVSLNVQIIQINLVLKNGCQARKVLFLVQIIQINLVLKNRVAQAEASNNVQIIQINLVLKNYR